MKEKNYKEAILEALDEGVIAIEKNEKIAFMNAKAVQMFKVEKTPLKLSDLPVSSLLLFCKKILKEKKGTFFSFKDANKNFFDLTVKYLEKKLILILKDRTTDNQMIQMGKDFVANASHELKTPITIIQGYAETLNELPKISLPMLKEMSGKILKTSERLNKIIKDLLLLAQIENFSKKAFESCDLSASLENCSKMLFSIHKNIKISLIKKQNRFFVKGNRQLIETAFLNILENAIKYSEKNPVITIDIKKRKDRVRISFQDNGIGIPEEDKVRIFERFYRVDKARTKGGTGLGLSLVKTIVEKHEGSIQATSNLQGSCFIMELPFVKN